jgi:Lrp/AsnC family leucine-responsive transcriptional regulator
MAAGHPYLDEVDRRMLAVLAEDGRISISDLAARVNVSRATAYTRFDRLREAGVITGFRAVIDHDALGSSVTALILVNVDQGLWRNVMPQLIGLPGVEYVALTSGAFDYVLLVRSPDVSSLRDVLLERLQSNPAVRSTQTIFVLNEQGHPAAAF